MNKYWCWVSAFLIIALASCNKKSDSNITVVQDTTVVGNKTYPDPALIGKWNWLVSSSNNSNIVLTPQSSGYTSKMEFVNDSVFNAYRNDTLILNSPYEIIKSKSIYDATIDKIIIVKKAPIRVSYYFKGTDSLILRQECIGCYVELYTKIYKK
jgi:hypothetical protein